MTNKQFPTDRQAFRPAALTGPPPSYARHFGVQATVEQEDEALWSILACQPGYNPDKIIGCTDAVLDDGFRYIDVYVA